MSGLRSGGLFAGYGGLEMAISEVFGAEPAWFSEIEPGPSMILAHHWPTIPNHGDITQIDWDQVEPVDILGGGFPCQDVSLAGKRAGLTPDSRSGLWNHFAYAISKLRPRYVVAENVRGLLSAEAHSDVEPCPWCLGEGSGEPDLRALGAVLGDLAELGYDAQWCGLRAADIGAPHGRYRIFILATNTDCTTGTRSRGISPGSSEGTPAEAERGTRRGSDSPTRDAQVCGRDDARPALGRGGSAWPAGGSGVTAADADRDALREQPVAESGCSGTALAGRAGDLASDTAGTRRGEGEDRSAGGDDESPRAWRGQPERGSRERVESAGEFGGRPDAPERGTSPAAWGQYGAAVERWERILGRVAPSPTEPNTKGSQRLSPQFVEWMMGLPAGHVTAVPGVNRNAQLKALGNGVVPQQAIAALHHMHATNQLLATA